MDALEKVLEVLSGSDKPLKAGEIAELAGLDKKEVEKAIKKLRESDKIQSPKRCYYSAK